MCLKRVWDSVRYETYQPVSLCGCIAAEERMDLRIANTDVGALS
ncbi:MAG: hypothetical protein R6U96_15055 [Promethearchaeia archaeon]